MNATFTLGKGMPRISSKNQVTLPVHVLSEAGLNAGDEVTIEATPDGGIVIRRYVGGIDAAIGIFNGLYEPGYLRKLREEDWD